MKDQLKVSLVQFSPHWLDSERNTERMADFIRAEAAEHGAELVVFPELATTGYIEPYTDRAFVKKFYEQTESVPGATSRLLSVAAAESNVHVVFGLARRHEQIPGLLYNSAVMIDPTGSVTQIYDKVHAGLDEKNYFALGSKCDVIQTSFGTVGLQVCYDMRFPELARIQALKGAEIIISLWAASPPPGAGPHPGIAERCVTRSMENGVYVVGCNRVGIEGTRSFFGKSLISDPSGIVLAQSKGQDEEVVRACLQGGLIQEQRAHLTIFRDRRPEMYGPICEPV